MHSASLTAHTSRAEQVSHRLVAAYLWLCRRLAADLAPIPLNLFVHACCEMQFVYKAYCLANGRLRLIYGLSALKQIMSP